jgi:hypothetical protein
MARIKILIFVLLGVAAFASCDDLIEKDLEDKKVDIISPADSIETELTNITFLWEDVKGADSYELQVVTPSFENALTVVVDTTLTDNTFSYEFTPGEYQWRIKAGNSVSFTEYFYRTITIQESDAGGEADEE